MRVGALYAHQFDGVADRRNLLKLQSDKHALGGASKQPAANQNLRQVWERGQRLRERGFASWGLFRIDRQDAKSPHSIDGAHDPLRTDKLRDVAAIPRPCHLARHRSRPVVAVESGQPIDNAIVPVAEGGIGLGHPWARIWPRAASGPPGCS